MKHLLALAALLLNAPLCSQSIVTPPQKGKTGGDRPIPSGSSQGGKDIDVGTATVGAAPPARLLKFRNPTQRGGLFGVDDRISLANQIETYVLSGQRNKAWIGRSIIVDDAASAPASGPATASYGLSIYMQRPRWNVSAITGELDPISIVVRQANGDTAGILSNILTRNGFGATLESYTGTANAAGTPVKAVNTQLGVSNSRDGTNYGLVVQSVLGSDLSAGIRIAASSGTSWRNYLEMVDPSGTPVAYIRGADGAFVGRSITPATSLTANIGAPAAVYANTFTRNLVLNMQKYATLPACDAAANGTIAYISDAETPITTWGQIVRAGGGRNRAYVSCNGTDWRVFSS